LFTEGKVHARLWLAGADSVTTNNLQGLLHMQRPALGLPYGMFLAVWGLLGLMHAFHKGA
jgi:hypothetical protein